MLSYGRAAHRLCQLVLVVLLLLVGNAAPAGASPTGQGLTEPEIGARSAIVVEYPSGRVLYSRGARDRLAPASTTKILTAILAIEYGKLQEVVTVTESDLVGESTMGLVAGEQQTMQELLYGLLLPSGNDAAMVIARSIGSKSASADPTLADPIARFVATMNARVVQLGLEDSKFQNPHGLDVNEHYSSAYDLASLSWYALHLPKFNEVVSKQSHDSPGHPLMNTNEMLSRYPGADGIKTGWTDAGGLCLVTSATRDGKRLISVVLNAPRWYSDSTALLDYGFAKLAATPVDPSAEVLSVSKRGTAGWLMANSASIQATSGSPASGQGGGGVSAPAIKGSVGVSAGDAADRKAAQAPSSALVLSSRPDTNVTAWAFAIFALLAGILVYLLAVRLLRTRLLPAGPWLSSSPKVSRAPVLTASRHNRHQPAPRTLPPGRTLGQTRPSRRREPNLLLTERETAATHLDNALTLASEGRQGASMSEFVNAMRLGVDLDVVRLTSEYELSAGAFLALARAQIASGSVEEARRTLLHGVLVFPNERVLRLALSQLR